MILDINPDLFFMDDDEVNDNLSKIIIALLNKGNIFWEIDSLYERIILEGDENDFSKTIFFKKFLSEYQQEKIYEIMGIILGKDIYITNEKRVYLTTIKVGYASGIPLETAIQIFNNPPMLIFENSVNDMKFIKGIVTKYKNALKRKAIYGLIFKSIENNLIVPDNAGGGGGIKNRISQLIDLNYKDIYKYRLFTLFDSDKKNIDDFPRDKKNLIKYLKNTESDSPDDLVYSNNDMIEWHMLDKREIENYLPIAVIENNTSIDDSDLNKIKGLSEEDYDYFDFENELRSINDAKKVLPELFLKDFNWKDIEKRCECISYKVNSETNADANVSEIEMLLLKIAKII